MLDIRLKELMEALLFGGGKGLVIALQEVVEAVVGDEGPFEGGDGLGVFGSAYDGAF